MPNRVRRRYYPAVTATVVALAGVNFAVYLGLPHIPRPEPNEWVHERGEYLSAASDQHIQWLKPTPSAFIRARYLERPILLFVGSHWSKAARDFDASVLRDPEVTGQLNFDFVCMRVDSLQDPGWMSAFLPLSRVELGIDPGFQVWALHPDGRVLELVVSSDAVRRYTAITFLPRLRELRGVAASPERDAVYAAQREEADLLNLRRRVPSVIVASYVPRLARAADLEYGGFPVAGVQRPNPLAWRHLMLIGEDRLLDRTMGGLLTSPVVDWVDGGFFRASSTLDWGSPLFEKVAIQNAEMASLVAALAVRRQDPYLRALALRTSQSLLREFVAGGAHFAYRWDPVGAMDRSPRNSLGYRDMRGLLTPDDRDVAEGVLNLDFAHNPRLSPYVSDPRAYLEVQEEADGLLERIRLSKVDEVTVYGGEGVLESSATVVARLLEVSRLLEDPQLQARSLELALRLDRHLVGANDVMRTVAPARSGTLHDYLAFAELQLQVFLTSGRVVALDRGLSVLRRAMILFSRDDPNALVIQPIESSPGVVDANVPQLLDGMSEAGTSRAIRLLYAYSAAFRRSPDISGGALLTRARSMVDAYAYIVNRMPRDVASFATAARMVGRDRFAVTGGKDAVSLAAYTERLAPGELVLPAVGALREEFGAVEGVLVFTDGRPSSILSPAEAARLLLARG